MPTHIGPGSLLRWIAAAGTAALIFAAGVSVALAEDDPSVSPRAVHLAPIADAPTMIGGSRHELVPIARRHLGKRAADLGLPSRLWCADFVNRVRREAGLPVVPSRPVSPAIRSASATGSRRRGSVPLP